MAACTVHINCHSCILDLFVILVRNGSYRVFLRESYFESAELKLFFLFLFATFNSLLNHQTEDAIMDLILRSVGKVIKVLVSHDLLQIVESSYHFDNRNYLVFFCQVSPSQLLPSKVLLDYLRPLISIHPTQSHPSPHIAVKTTSSLKI